MKKFIPLILLCAFLLTGCKNNSVSYGSQNNQYIEAITPAAIDRLGKIAVSFVYEPKCPIGEAIYLSPAQSGTWEFDERSAVFTPDRPYKANSTITLSVNCGKLFGTDDKNDVYRQKYNVSSPFYDISFDEIRYNDSSESYVVSGKVTTDIPVSSDELKKSLKARLENKKQKINWQQSNQKTVWNFSLDDIPSGDSKSALSIKWAAKALGMTRKQVKYSSINKMIEIPAKSVFSVLDINTSKQTRFW